MERDLKIIVKRLCIEFAECFKIGAMIKIQCMIEEQDPRITREDIEAYIRLQQQFILDLKLYTRIMDAQQATLAAHMMAKSQRAADRIEPAADDPHAGMAFVYDNFLETITWTRNELVQREPERFLDIETARAKGKIKEDHVSKTSATE